jgi:hypothetical protein
MCIGIDDFHIRFNTTGRVGALLKVHETRPCVPALSMPAS